MPPRSPLRFRLAPGRCRRNEARDAALPRFERATLFELDGLAHDGLAAFGQGREVFPHRCKRHSHLPGDLEIQALAMLFQVLKSFGHCDVPSGWATVNYTPNGVLTEDGTLASGITTPE